LLTGLLGAKDSLDRQATKGVPTKCGRPQQAAIVTVAIGAAGSSHLEHDDKPHDAAVVAMSAEPAIAESRFDEANAYLDQALAIKAGAVLTDKYKPIRHFASQGSERCILIARK
jgi:hypothetical protein